MANTLDFIIKYNQQNQQQVLQGAAQVGAALQQLGVQANITLQPINQLSRSSMNLGDIIGKVGERALVTIPIWMALREAFMGVVRGGESAVKSIVEIDTAMRNLQVQLKGTQNAAEVLSQVKNAATNLSLETGLEPGKIIDAFNQLVTLGYDVKTSMSIMDTATRGAIATNSEATDIVGTLNNVYRELGDTITAVHAPADKFNYIMGTMAVLMGQNKISMKEFEESLRSFAGQAQASGLTMDQTLALIASSAQVSQFGLQGGTQLANAFRQIGLHPEEIQGFLGHSISGMSQLDMFVETLKKLNQIGTIPNDLTKIFSFRGGGREVRALFPDIDKVLAQMKELSSLTPNDRWNAFLERFGTESQKIAVQGDRVKQAFDFLGRNFVEGLAGGDNYAASLKKIADSLDTLNEKAKDAGKAIHDLFNFVGGPQFFKGIGSAGPGSSVGQQMVAAYSPTNIFTALGLMGDILDNYRKVEQMNKYAASIAVDNMFRGPEKPSIQTTSSSPAETLPQTKKAIISVTEAVDVLKEKQYQLQMLGYNDLEIQKAKLDYLKEQGLAQSDLYDKVSRTNFLEKESLKATDEYLSSANKSLTDLFMGDVTNPAKHTKGYNPAGPIGIVAQKFGNSIRKGYDSAFAGDIVEQLFGKTGIAGLFGTQSTALRHASDDPMYKATHDGTYNGILDAFKDMTSGSGGGKAATVSSYGSAIPNALKFITGGMTVFGSLGATTSAFNGGGLASYSLAHLMGGISSSGGGGGLGNLGAISVSPNLLNMTGWSLSQPSSPAAQMYNNILSQSSSASVAKTGNNPLSNMASGFNKLFGINTSGNGPAWTLPGFGQGGFMQQKIPGMGNLTGAGAIGSLFQGFSTYESLGGSSGSTALPSSILQTVGAAAMLAGQPEIGIPLEVIGMITSLFNTTTKTTTQTHETTKQLGSKLDESNKQLSMINRNLVAMKSSIDTYIMPNSAYFATKGNLSDQFAIDALRGGSA